MLPRDFFLRSKVTFHQPHRAPQVQAALGWLCGKILWLPCVVLNSSQPVKKDAKRVAGQAVTGLCRMKIRMKINDV